jgi:hypothetical protein
VIGKVADVALAGMVTVVGTVTPTEVLSLASVIVRPAAGAGTAIETVPVEPFAPSTELGETLSAKDGGLMVRVADTGIGLTGSGDATSVAVITSLVLLVTAVVITLNVCETALPAFTITSVGIRMPDGLPDTRASAMFCGAFALSVTSPVTTVPSPPTTESGVRAMDSGTMGVITRFALAEPPEYVAVIGAVCSAGTMVVVAWKVTNVAPPGIVMEAGSFTAELVVDSATRIPPVGATLESVTVPVDG